MALDSIDYEVYSASANCNSYSLSSHRDVSMANDGINPESSRNRFVFLDVLEPKHRNRPKILISVDCLRSIWRTIRLTMLILCKYSISLYVPLYVGYIVKYIACMRRLHFSPLPSSYRIILTASVFVLSPAFIYRSARGQALISTASPHNSPHHPPYRQLTAACYGPLFSLSMQRQLPAWSGGSARGLR